MITLTRFNGDRFAVNPDLIQRVQATPDTHLVLVDGTSVPVKEKVEDVIALTVEFRGRVLASALTQAATAARTEGDN